MPIDEATVATGTPRTLDGRPYPEHLRAYERFDAPLLTLAAALLEPFSFDDLAAAAAGAGLRDVVPRWVASAEWRVLLRRADASMASPRAYALTDQAQQRLAELVARRAA